MVTTNLFSLIDGIARGDADDLLRFYDRTSSRVFGVIGNLVPDPAEREQLMERIYLAVWQQAADYDSETFSPGAWLITLAHQMAVEHARADAGTTVVPLRDDSTAPGLGALPAVQRKCVELTYYRGMTVAQASAHLGMTAEATSGALCDAVDTMTPDAGQLASAG